MDDLLQILLEPLFDLIVMVVAAILGSMVFGARGAGSFRQDKIQTIFDGDPYSRNQSL
jgi:hypothetical protein